MATGHFKAGGFMRLRLFRQKRYQNRRDRL